MPLRRLVHLDDLHALVGQEVAVSDWLPMPQEMIDAFAQITRDPQWIHMDPVRAAAESPYKSTIAHGFLTLSLLTFLHTSSLEIEQGCQRIINYGLDRVRFPTAVPSGASIRSRSVLQACDEQPDYLHLTWQITIEIQGQSKPALVAQWLLRLYRA